MYSQIIKEGFLNLETVPEAKTLTNRGTFHKRLTLMILHKHSCKDTNTFNSKKLVHITKDVELSDHKNSRSHEVHELTHLPRADWCEHCHFPGRCRKEVEPKQEVLSTFEQWPVLLVLVWHFLLELRHILLATSNSFPWLEAQPVFGLRHLLCCGHCAVCRASERF